MLEIVKNGYMLQHRHSVYTGFYTTEAAGQLYYIRKIHKPVVKISLGLSHNIVTTGQDGKVLLET